MKVRYSPDEEAYQKIIKIRGDVIGSIISLEELINLLLAIHFTGEKVDKERLFALLEMLSEPEFTLMFKIKTINRRGLLDEYKDKKINEKLKRIIEIRNILAHSSIKLHHFEIFGDVSEAVSKKDTKNLITKITPTMEIKHRKEKEKNPEELYKEFREIYHIVHGTVAERLFGKENYKKLKGE